ncbi:LOW QUALITY PROTEIN: interferon regulatory factor 3 [Tachyglossus aculeatus]|uniref:LOW QUALITY PROTEIN: interferon regulatory factor 3 n=1 Tax=Tachyglossus aculeatus TaxID=9261 RepID=UPI0018F2E9F2|nr:LOW QUALITY PROTEIN: interferon regulatory factor 3 [Tachyglossus aculeatus]
MGTPKPLIVPWLRDQLDRGLLDGVAWTDATRTRFRVPWKHGLRQDAQEQDFRLFEAWAVASGAYRPNIDPRAPSIWKRNFRSALNRKGLRVVQDHSRDSQDPHKIYEFLGSEDNGTAVDSSADGSGREESQDGTGWSQDTIQEDILDEVLGNLALSPTPVSQERAPPADPHQVAQLFAETEFEVTVFYRGTQVAQQRVPALGGLRVVGRQGQSPGPAVELVLPDPGVLSDRKVAGYVQRVRDSLVPGLHLWATQTELRAQRLGHCHVYWGRGVLPREDPPHGAVTKEDGGSCLYHINEFVQEMIPFLNGGSRSPQYVLWFCLGEVWPNKDVPWNKKLVMVKVVPLSLQLLHDIGRDGGASSLDDRDVDLRISDSVPDLITLLQDFCESMDTAPPASQ